MAQNQSKPKSSSYDPIPREFAVARKKRIDEFINLQTELLGELQETNRRI